MLNAADEGGVDLRVGRRLLPGWRRPALGHGEAPVSQLNPLRPLRYVVGSRSLSW
jgi:hypothetical protein